MTRWDKILAALVVIAAVGVTIAVTQHTVTDTRRRIDEASYGLSIKDWHAKLNGCQRGKTDRTMIAQALRAQSTYLNSVLDAASVKADVKRAARKAQAVFNASATDLESRTGRALVCAAVYPKPAAPAGVAPLP